MKLGNNKKERNIVLCYFIGIIGSGLGIAIWTGITMHWFIGLSFLSIWWFAFLIIPFCMDMEGREDAQRSAQEKDRRKNAYKRKRGWE